MTFQAGLDNHGHKFVGEFDTEDEATKAASDYIEVWLDGRGAIEVCECSEIGGQGE